MPLHAFELKISNGMKDILKVVVYGGIFAVPFISLIISNSMFFPYITGKNFTFRIIVEIIFAAWVLLALYDAQYRPKFSWILGSFASLLVIMAFADALGKDPHMSFWSNFERMEGYVTLMHTFVYFIVVGSMLTTEKLWNRFFNATMLSAVILSLYAFAQLSGNITINQGGWRLDGTLGNSAYMAIYMLFHVFIALFMFLRAKGRGWRVLYGFLTLLFIYLLIQTATRGTILGLAGGLTVTAAYVALFTKEHPKVRKYAAGGLLAMVLLVGLFIGFRKSEIIQHNPYLARVANITLSEGSLRFKIWHMAYEGFKERPILGWGQSNFNYVFNKQYDPSIYYAESWYDRVHDIFFDWLIAGGILGVLAYFSIFFSALYYLIIAPLRKGYSEQFTVVERGVLFGLLLGYLFHNLFVFDNIVSYVFYGTILALIHMRVARPIAPVTAKKFDAQIVEQVVAPIVGVALVAVLYFVNVPGITAAQGIIDAFKAKTPEQMLVAFDKALAAESFGDQEIREQMTRRAQEVQQSQDASSEIKQKFLDRVEEELKKEVAEKPDDARVRVFISSFYRLTGQLDKAIPELEASRALSPDKQQIIFEQGLAYLQKGEYEKARDYFKEAYDLDTTYGDARIYYAMSAVRTGDLDVVDELLTDESQKNAFAQSDLTVQALYQAELYPRLIDAFERRVVLNPNDTQTRTNLAYILDESGDTAGAIEVLKKAGEDIPSFKAQADEFMKNLVSKNLETAGALPEAKGGGEVIEVKKP